MVGMDVDVYDWSETHFRYWGLNWLRTQGIHWGSSRIYAVRRLLFCKINCKRVIWEQTEMITRSNLAEQLRDYQIRSQHKWAPLTFFSSTTQITSGSDAAKAGLWALLFLALLIFSFIALYLRYQWLAFTFVCLAILLPICLKIVRQTTLARKRRRRMLLPLSMWTVYVNAIKIWVIAEDLQQLSLKKVTCGVQHPMLANRLVYVRRHKWLIMSISCLASNSVFLSDFRNFSHSICSCLFSLELELVEFHYALGSFKIQRTWLLSRSWFTMGLVDCVNV